MKTKQLVQCDPRVVAGVTMTRKWEYKEDANRVLVPSDVVEFTCNGKGRGGHYNVRAAVTKVNKKTFQCVEIAGSYAPATMWTVTFDTPSLYVLL